ncbi:MAG TPA: MqnA/MqnD/SBP family protein [Terriglobia bacterium]|nr:MqnA/MqnD/SBP family protein [Terriglobia bacterium]
MADDVKSQVIDLKLAHSPDSDDAFMFYALATKKLRTGNLRFTHVLEDIESLNQKATEGVYDVTAISFHAYAYLADRYVLLPNGASFGDRYGPIVVGRAQPSSDSLKGRRIAVPGKLTSAFLALKLYEPSFEPVLTPFDQILETVVKGGADAGVLIHEGQLVYSHAGLRKIVDLGEWWHQETGLPLPLGANAILRSLDREIQQQVCRSLRESIQYALDHRDEALAYAMQFSRGLDISGTDRFVAMYVNEWTLDYGDRGRQAVQILLDRGYEKGLLPRPVQAEFIEWRPA